MTMASQASDQAANLEQLRGLLAEVSVRDLVPTLVARNVLYSHEMGTIYSQAGSSAMRHHPNRPLYLRRTRTRGLAS